MHNEHIFDWQLCILGTPPAVDAMPASERRLCRRDMSVQKGAADEGTDLVWAQQGFQERRQVMVEPERRTRGQVPQGRVAVLAVLHGEYHLQAAVAFLRNDNHETEMLRHMRA